MSPDPTSALAHALAVKRVLDRQCAALAAFAAASATWAVEGLPGPTHLAVVLAVAAAALLAAELVLPRRVAARAARAADALILVGGPAWNGRTPVARAARRRSEWIVRRRSRRRLARGLRCRLALTQGSSPLSPDSILAATLPPLTTYERHALLAERALVHHLADRVEEAPADPRALIVLWSVVLAPPSLDAGAGRSAGEELRRRIQAAAAIIEPANAEADAPSASPFSRAPLPRHRW